MIDELPGGWAAAPLPELFEINPPKPSADAMAATAAVSFVPMPAVDADAGAITAPEERAFRTVRKGYTAFRDGDVILAKITPCFENGKAAVARRLRNGLGFGSSEFHVLRSRGVVLPEYLFHFVRQRRFRQEAADHMTGTAGQARVPVDYLREVVLPVPPIAEQRRIVENVEAVLARVKAARERLARVPLILKRFRQAALAAACSGRLTEEWRDAHPEVALALPARPHRTAAARRGRRGANLSIEGELLLDGMPDLPVSWAYRRADEVVERGTVITYGIVLPGPEVSGGVPYVRQQDVLEDGTICMDQLRHTTIQIAGRHDRSSLRAGDVLLCIIRNLRVGLVPQGLDGANITQGTVRMRPADLIRPEYLAAYLASPHAQEWMKERYFGMDMPRINVEDARAIPIAVPPLLEQDEVLRRIGILLSLADAVHRRVEKGTTRANMLAQAVLTKAFSGELVPTEAELARAEGRDYEPASALLERIRAGHAMSSPPRAAGRRKRDSAQGRRAGRRAAQR